MDVTWPNPPPEIAFGVVSGWTWLKFAAVCWSFMPVLVICKVVISFLIGRGTRQLFVLLWAGMVCLSNEFLFKHLVKTPRPGTMLQVVDEGGGYIGSCSATCGMPSSHAMLASGWFALIFLDASFRLHPRSSLIEQSFLPNFFGSAPAVLGGEHTEACQLPHQSSMGFGSMIMTFNRISFRGLCRREWKQWGHFLRLFWLVPWVGKDSLTHEEFLAYMTIWTIIMLPVPYMRYELRDHDADQVAFGMLVGLISAIVWWRVVRSFQRMYEHKVGTYFFFGLIVHNYPLPRFHITEHGLTAVTMVERGSSNVLPGNGVTMSMRSAPA